MATPLDPPNQQYDLNATEISTNIQLKVKFSLFIFHLPKEISCTGRDFAKSSAVLATRQHETKGNLSNLWHFSLSE